MLDMANLYWTIPEKKQAGGTLTGWGHTFLKKNPGIFTFVTLLLEIPDKMKQKPKTIPHKNQNLQIFQMTSSKSCKQ